MKHRKTFIVLIDDDKANTVDCELLKVLIKKGLPHEGMEVFTTKCLSPDTLKSMDHDLYGV